MGYKLHSIEEEKQMVREYIEGVSVKTLMIKYGYKTKQNNRQGMIELFALAFRDNPKIINDYATVCEMESFQIVRNERSGSEKAQATGGAHDDLVMACCGFYLCRGSQKAIPFQEEQSKKYSIEEIELKLLERKKPETNRRVYNGKVS